MFLLFFFQTLFVLFDQCYCFISVWKSYTFSACILAWPLTRTTKGCCQTWNICFLTTPFCDMSAFGYKVIVHYLLCRAKITCKCLFIHTINVKHKVPFKDVYCFVGGHSRASVTAWERKLFSEPPSFPDICFQLENVFHDLGGVVHSLHHLQNDPTRECLIGENCHSGNFRVLNWL